MELELEFEKGCGSHSFFITTEGGGRAEVIRVWNHSNDNISDVFDPERTCRTIEKMKELLEYMEAHYNWYFLDEGADFHKVWTKDRIKKLMSYIEHGDKEEMVYCLVSVDGTIAKSNLKQIPKSEAIRLKLIEE